MSSNRDLIFVSPKTWESYTDENFRTRTGSLLRAFILSKEFSRIFLFVGTGFGGEKKISSIRVPDAACQLTQVLIPGWLPESVILALSPHVAYLNYGIPTEISSDLKTAPSSFIWGYQAGLGNKLQREFKLPFLYDVIDYRVKDANLSISQQKNWKKELNIASQFANIVVCNGETAYRELGKQVKKLCVILRNGVDPKRIRSTCSLKKASWSRFCWCDF